MLQEWDQFQTLNAGETLSMISMRNGLVRQEAFNHTESSDEGFWEDERQNDGGESFLFVNLYFDLYFVNNSVIIFTFS